MFFFIRNLQYIGILNVYKKKINVYILSFTREGPRSAHQTASSESTEAEYLLLLISRRHVKSTITPITFAATYIQHILVFTITEIIY